MVNLADYFQYHPPKTDARRIAHDSVNYLCLMACQSLFATNDPAIVRQICNELSDRLFEITQEPVCLKWIKASLDRIKDTLICCDEESTLMLIQQVRMFANQAVTLDELRLQDVHPRRKYHLLASQLVTSDKLRLQDVHGESLMVALDDANLLDGEEKS